MKLFDVKKLINKVFDIRIKLKYVFAFYIILNIYMIMNKQKVDRELKLDNILDRAIDKTKLDEFFGTWKVDDEKHPVREFTIKKENIIESKNKNDGHSVCSKCKSVYNSNIKYVVNVPLSCVKFKNHIRMLHTHLSHESNYRFVLHENGVIKFVPNNSNILNKLMLARTDSKSLFDLVANLIHVKNHGCFCLGILTKYKTIERYNRWNNEHIDKYWTAYRIN